MQEKKRELGQMICHASRLFRRQMDHSISAAMGDDADEVFSGRNLWVLRYVKEHEGEEIYQRDLEKTFRLRRSTISNMIDLMVRKQFLVREQVPGDKRLKRLLLTEKGEAILCEVAHAAEAMETALREQFSPGEYTELTGLLERLNDSLESLPETIERKETEQTNG